MTNLLKQYQFREVSKILEQHHSVFYKMWEFGTPEFTDSISTAALVFDAKSYKPLKFQFNPTFWEELDVESRSFLVAHECLHALLNHGIRSKELKNSMENRAVINIAMDLAINHMLVYCFGFERENLKIGEMGCWVDTVFKDIEVNDLLSMEEYYDLLLENDSLSKLTLMSSSDLLSELKNNDQKDSNQNNDQKDSNQNNDQKDSNQIFILDDHESLGEIDISELSRLILTKIDNYEVKSLENQISSIFPGENIASSLLIPPKAKLKPTSKWEKIVRQWKRIGINPPDDSEIWTQISRRNACLTSDVILPSYGESDENEYCKSKLNAWIFLDVSGSCIALRKHFFLAYDTISTKRFNKRMFVFADSVAEIFERKGSADVGGGTSFTAIRDYVDNEVKATGIEPDIVMIITDGHSWHPGNYPFPEKWHWFLEQVNHLSTEVNYEKYFNEQRRIINTKSSAHLLKDYFALES
jgi:hypothetical protein